MESDARNIILNVLEIMDFENLVKVLHETSFKVLEFINFENL